MLAGLLLSLRPQQILRQDTNLTSCFTKITGLLGTVPLFESSIENWCKQLPLDSLEGNLERGEFSEPDVVLAHSLKLVLTRFKIKDPEFASLGRRSRRWLATILDHNSTGLVEKRLSYLEYFTDILQLALTFNEDEVDCVLVERLGGEGFCERFMPALYRHLTRKALAPIPPIELMVGHPMRRVSELLNEIVSYCAKTRDSEECDKVLKLVDGVSALNLSISSSRSGFVVV